MIIGDLPQPTRGNRPRVFRVCAVVGDPHERLDGGRAQLAENVRQLLECPIVELIAQFRQDGDERLDGRFILQIGQRSPGRHRQ